MQRVLIATDGSGTSEGPGGWAAILRYGGAVKELFGFAEQATNNTMEITAAIMGLAQLKRPCTVEVTTDSEYLLKGITEWVPMWKSRNWITKQGKLVKNRELWEELHAQCARHRVTWKWTRGHAGHPDNERADELAGIQRRNAIAARQPVEVIP